MENHKRDILILFLLFLGIPFIGYLLYTGNNGNLYSYYLTGYYLIIVLLFSYLISFIGNSQIGKAVLFLFLLAFVKSNLHLTVGRLNNNAFNTNGINFETQLAAVGWIKDDAKDEKFNIDVYVPPVIPHSYDYLFQWEGIIQEKNNVNLLYTLYEDDPPHPERLDAWIERQEKIGKVIYQEKFGGITVQRRERLKIKK